MRGSTVGWFRALVRLVSSASSAELMKLSLLSTTKAICGWFSSYTRRENCDGIITAPSSLPLQFSRRVYEENHPQIALVVDNSDNFMSSALEAELTSLTNALNQPTIEPRILQQTALEIVELYPYIEYMKYLLPGSLTLAMFVSVMIGGGMLYIDDKARGVHDGYLVTPITKLELVLGLNLAGAI